MGVERDVFATRFATSAREAWAVAREFIVEELPAPLVFRVRLNRSYDGNPLKPGEVKFPEDSAWPRATALNKCDEATVVSELWRDGRVPEWINLGVVARTETATVVQVVCCGRYTDDDAGLYHARGGVSPFHVVGPSLPPFHGGGRFSVHVRTECWDRSDVADMSSGAGAVWSFDLMTDVFDDNLLAGLPGMPNVEIFEHHDCTLPSPVMSAFDRFPRLRIVRLHLAAPDTFRVGAIERPLDNLTDLAITNLPARPWGHGELADIAPAVTRVTFGAARTLRLDGAIGPSVREVTLTAADISDSIHLPSRLDMLGIHLTRGTDEAVARLLSEVTHVGSLSLRGTPVTDAVIPIVERLNGLKGLDLVHTATTAAALARFRGDHPDIGIHPRTPPFRPADIQVLRSSDKH